MSIVVGVSPAHEAHEGVALATVLARSAGTDVVVVAIVPTPWRGRALQVDRDYQDYLTEMARETLATISETLPGNVSCRTVVRRAERDTVTLSRHDAVRPQAIRYLNRLSDLLFVLARVLARADGQGEVLWEHARRK